MPATLSDRLPGPPAGGEGTARAFAQQPDLWAGLADLLGQAQAQVDGLLQAWLRQPTNRVILTGAGSPGFIAEMAASQVDATDSWLAPLWLTAAQRYALRRSVAMGFTPDDPFPDGTVNRIVRGVTIHHA